MVDFQNNNFNRPRLKKVKRPINRAVPQMPPAEETASDEPLANKPEALVEQSPFSTTSAVPQNQNSNIVKAFDLDSYLDDNTSLPEVKNVPNNPQRNPNPKFLGSDEYEILPPEIPEEESELDEPVEYPLYANKKVLLIFAFLLLFIGFVVGKLTTSTSRIVRSGLQGVVVNAEIPRGRVRCGLAERNQGCVLYLMNPQRQELSVKDFYDLAAQLTGRQRFVIETGNMRYANTKIKPGDIAQINIPPL